MTSLRPIRWLAWGAVAIVGGLFIGLSGLLPGQQHSGQPPILTTDDLAAIGGPFELTTHHGETFDHTRLAGQPYLIFFGFTHCPDVCPTTLLELTDLMKQLGPDADRLKVLFVTIDPARDRQELLAEYMTSFDERIIALHGSQQDIDAIVKAYSAFVRKVPLEGGQYTMDHSTGVYLMNENGRFSGMLDMHEPQTSKLEKVRRLVRSSR